MTNEFSEIGTYCRDATIAGVVVGGIAYIEHALWAKSLDDLAPEEPELTLLVRYTLGATATALGYFGLAWKWRSVKMFIAGVGLVLGGIPIVAARLHERSLRSVRDDGKRLGHVAGLLEGVRLYVEAYGRTTARDRVVGGFGRDD